MTDSAWSIEDDKCVGVLMWEDDSGRRCVGD